MRVVPGIADERGASNSPGGLGDAGIAAKGGEHGCLRPETQFCGQVFQVFADALVIESTYAAHEAEMAARFGHLTVTQAAELAVAADVGHLFLVHISRRYSAREIVRQARQIFARSTVPSDLDHYRVAKGKATKVRPRDLDQPLSGDREAASRAVDSP